MTSTATGTTSSGRARIDGDRSTSPFPAPYVVSRANDTYAQALAARASASPLALREAASVSTLVTGVCDAMVNAEMRELRTREVLPKGPAPSRPREA
jgi:hypothetical protein